MRRVVGVLALIAVSSCGEVGAPVAIQSVEITLAADTLTAIGATVQLVAVAKDSEGRVVPGQTFTWVSSNNSVATVNSNGLVTAVGSGWATIEVELRGISRGSCSIHVFTEADVYPDEVTLALGQTWRLLVETDGLTDGAESVFQWMSSDPSVAAVDTAGVVTALKAGTATVTASKEGVSDATVLTVSDAVQVEWQLVGGGGFGPPAIAPDGTIYVPSTVVSPASTGCEGWVCSTGATQLSSIDPGGEQTWAITGGRSSPAIGSDGTVYSWGVGGLLAVGELLAIRPDGSTRWSYDAGTSLATWLSGSLPAIASDGTVYVGAGNRVLAVDANGTLMWEFAAGDIMGTPAIGADGTVYVRSRGGVGHEVGNLHAVNSDGSGGWEVPVGPGSSSPAIAADGTLYVGSPDGRIYAVNSNGTVDWESVLESGVTLPPVIGVDGTVYVVSDDAVIHALRADGTKRWVLQLAGPWGGPSSPAIAADGTLYVISGGLLHNDIPYGSVCYALNTDGSIKWQFNIEGGSVSSPAIAPDGTIYIGSGSSTAGFFYAISETAGSNGGLADAPWPKSGHDMRNTGNVSTR